MPFFSAWGCCAICHRVVTVRAGALTEAAGSKPYSHKATLGPRLPWCAGVGYPALHFTESMDTKTVEEIKTVLWQSLTYFANRAHREKE